MATCQSIDARTDIQAEDAEKFIAELDLLDDNTPLPIAFTAKAGIAFEDADLCQNSEADSSPLLESLWQRFRESPESNEAKQAVCGQYTDWITHIARQVHFVYLPHRSIEELVSDGYLALMTAVSRWDHTRGATFQTYAWHHLRGAMLRSAVEGRYTSEMRIKLTRARARESHRHGRRLNDYELSQALGMPEERLDQQLTAVAGKGKSHELQNARAKTPPIGTEIEAAETATIVSAAIATLSEKYQAAMVARYSSEFSEADLSRQRGVSRQAVSHWSIAAHSRICPMLATRRFSLVMR